MVSVCLTLLSLLLLQQLVVAIVNYDTQRVGIVIKLFTESEYQTRCQDEVNVDGKIYKKVKTATGSEVRVEKPLKEHLLIVNEYCADNTVSDCYNLMVVTNMKGVNVGQFVTAAKLVPLKDKNELLFGVFEIPDKDQILELVGIDGMCTQVKNGAADASFSSYDCSNQNFIHYDPDRRIIPVEDKN